MIRISSVEPEAIATASAMQAASNNPVDHLLGAAQRDRPAGQELLQLGERDVRAPEGDRARRSHANSEKIAT